MRHCLIYIVAMRASTAVYSVRLVKDRTVRYAVREVGHSDHAAALLRALIGGADREHLAAVFLDCRNEVIGVHIVAVGGLSGAQTTSREVFRAAITAGAAAIVLGHNHPSGSPEPSREDVAFTRTIVAAGKLLGVEVVDHVVIGEGAHVSMFERGLLRP